MRSFLVHLTPTGWHLLGDYGLGQAFPAPRKVVKYLYPQNGQQLKGWHTAQLWLAALPWHGKFMEPSTLLPELVSPLGPSRVGQNCCRLPLSPLSGAFLCLGSFQCTWREGDGGRGCDRERQGP